MSALTAVELFAGAGGLALGAGCAGFQHAALFEWDADACATLRRNRPAWTVVEGDVRDVDLHRYEGVDLVAGGPPCQDFSTAGSRALAKGERNMFPEAIRAVKEIRPRAVLLENVTGLVKGAARPYFEGYVLRRLRELGYDAKWRVLNAADHGTPQLRQRVITVAFRRDVRARVAWPSPSWPRRTVREALAGLPAQPRPAWADAVPGQKGILQQHHLDAPAWTFTTVVASTLLREDDGRMRFLALRELARLQTFPDAWAFAGDDYSQLRQIGNAVPVALAHALMGAVTEALI